MMSNLKLPAFWADAPVAWFAAAEAQFQLGHGASQSEKFCHITAAPDKLSLKKVVHSVISPHPQLPYNKLKEALLASHQQPVQAATSPSPPTEQPGWPADTSRHCSLYSGSGGYRLVFLPLVLW